MGWRSTLGWIAIGLLSFLALSHGQSLKVTGGPDIPDHLLECYRNQSIYHRAFRLPSTIGTVISLIKKIEASSTGRNYNARELSQILQYYVRMDGIKPSEYLSSNDGFNSGDDAVLPFAASGDEFFRHRLSVVKLIRASSAVSRTFFNESLSVKELCNLHFMLSYSTDSRKRSDEQCVPQDEIIGAFSRGKRDTSNETVQEDIKTVDEKATSEDSQDVNEDVKDNKIDHDVEQLPPDIISILEGAKGDSTAATEKEESAEVKSEDFRIGNSELLSAGLVQGSRGNGRLFGSKAADRNTNRYGDRYGDSVLRGGSGARYVPSMEKSDCPVENGVVFTKYGSVTLGTVIAGIAAGLNPQDINPTEFGIAAADIRPDLSGTRVNNVWASTVAGNIADMILNVGAIGVNSLDNAAGLKGWWNDTINYQWYLLQKDQPTYLTDVEVRGSIDGLVLGQNVRKWPDMKLSQILTLYYSEINSIDQSIQACKRKESFSKAIQNDDFIRQVEIFCNVMAKQRPNTATITDFAQLVNSATNSVQRYVESLDTSMTCSSGEYTSSGPTDYSLTLAVVVDKNWQPDTLVNILRILADKEVLASPFNSNTTFLCGNNGEVLFTASDPAGLSSNFTLRNCDGGLNVNAALFGLEKIFRPLYTEEKLTGQMKKGSFAAMFLPSSPSSITNNSDVVDTIRKFNYTMPDVKFIVVTTGGKDAFSYLVSDPNNDVFVVRAPTPADRQSQQDFIPVASKLKKIPQRLVYPRCGSYSEYEQGDGKLTDTVRVSYTKNYRLHPNYFYTISGSPRISVRSVNGVPLTVCTSRNNPTPVGDPPSNGNNPGNNPNYPGNPTGGGQYPNNNNYYGGRFGGYNTPNNYYGRQVAADTTCVQVTQSAVDLKLDSDPCDNYGSISSCPPIYVSVTAPVGNTPAINNVCQKDYCRYPTDAEFEFTVNNLSCDSGVGQINIQPLVLVFTFLFIAFAQRLF